MMDMNPEEKDLRNRRRKIHFILFLVLYIISLLIVYGIAFLFGVIVGTEHAHAKWAFLPLSTFRS